MINVRFLTETDNLEDAADLVFQVDPYICPDFFGDEERAKKIGKVIFNHENKLFDYDHILVAEDPEIQGKLLGILVFADNTIADWNCDEILEKVKSLEIDLPENFERANRNYMKPVVDEAKKLDYGAVEIEFLATDKNFRGRGVAQALLNYFFGLSQYNEHHLTVLSDNLAAIHVYEKKGFKTVSYQTGYPDDLVKTQSMVHESTLKIPIEVSARHVHLSQHIVNVLFGENYELSPMRNLSQPNEFIAKERIDIVGPREILHNVALLGPVRKHTQVELSLTDARKVGLTPPVRESGDHAGSASCRLVGPVGEFELEDGVIIARRHLHINPAQAKKLGVENGDFISIEAKKCLRPIIFKDVLVRVGENYNLTMHVDTDEGNAASLTPDSYGEVVNL